jgi:LPS export ABC transporter protein LptC
MRSLLTLRSLLGMLVLGSMGGVAALLWLALTPEKNSLPPKPELAADLKLDRVHYLETREGVKEWELEAASAVYFKDENTVVLEKVRAVFYGKGEESYVLLGEKGKYNTQTKVIEVTDGVKIDSSQGYHLRTRSLTYQSEQRELRTSDPVEMRGPDLEVTGVGMVVELNRQRVRILGGVTTVFSSLGTKKPSKPNGGKGEGGYGLPGQGS